MKKSIKITINGEEQTLQVEPRLLLVHLIRETLNLTGTHIGCDTSSCGGLHGVARRPIGQIMHLAGSASRRSIHYDHRGNSRRRANFRPYKKALKNATPCTVASARQV